MSAINELTSSISTSTYTSSAIASTSSTDGKDFDSVMLKVLKNCNGQRPEHVCCYHGSNASANESVDSTEEVSSIDDKTAVSIDETPESEATEEEKLTAGSCFTMFIRITARLSNEVGNALSGKFKDTTLAFTDALRSDKTHNENILKAYMQKTNSLLSAQTEELKSFIGTYLDNMFSAVNSSISGLNSTLLSSSNLLGSSISDYSNLLSNSSLLGASNLLGSSNNLLGSSVLSSISSSLGNLSNSSSLAGYSAIDVANLKLNAMISGKSNYTYGIGTSLNLDRYSGRNLSMIRSSEIETTASGIRMVDTKGNTTTGIAPTSIEIGNSTSQTISTASSADDSNVSVASNVKDDASEIEIKLASNNEAQKSYSDALLRKNHIVDLFK